MPPAPEVDHSLAALLYADTLTELCDAVGTGSRTALLTGADARSRRALAALALPGAHTASCLCALLQPPASPPLLLGLVDVAREKGLVLHDAHEPAAVPALVGLLDAAPRAFAILATAAQPADVAPQLRRAHRLDAHVHVRAPSAAARARAARLVAELLDQDAREELAEKLVSAAPGCGVAAFVAAAAAYYTAPPQRAIDALLAAAPRASPLPYASVLRREEGCGLGSVGGYEDVKRVLLDALGVDAAREATMKRLGVRPPRGVLLHGARGVGKSALARAVATETPTRTWLYVACGDVYSRYLGESEARVRKLFAHARECAPCVVVLDDIDALAADRRQQDAGGTGVERRVLGALLTEMDGVNTAARDGVQVLACTARLDAIDAAILRPGRFDRIVQVPLPNVRERVQILSVVARQMPVAVTECAVGGDEDEDEDEEKVAVFHKVADRTEGCTGADLAAICRRAAMVAMAESESPKVVLERHFIHAVQESCNVGHNVKHPP